MFCFICDVGVWKSWIFRPLPIPDLQIRDAQPLSYLFLFKRTQYHLHAPVCNTFLVFLHLTLIHWSSVDHCSQFHSLGVLYFCYIQEMLSFPFSIWVCVHNATGWQEFSHWTILVSQNNEYDFRFWKKIAEKMWLSLNLDLPEREISLAINNAFCIFNSVVLAFKTHNE